MDAKRRERTNAKRSLTRAQNLLLSILDDNSDVDIVKNRFSEVLILRENGHTSHEEYLAGIPDASEEKLEEEDEWLVNIENTFIEVERRNVEYCKAFNTAETELKQEALADSDSSRVHDERESTALATSIRLRHMEENSFKQYIHDFLRLLETAGIDGSSYLVKDAYEHFADVHSGRCIVQHEPNMYIGVMCPQCSES